jgi:multisubunit Na+/H+ antiporter MnhF subunit
MLAAVLIIVGLVSGVALAKMRYGPNVALSFSMVYGILAFIIMSVVK